LRELDKMAMSRLRSEWDQTSSLQATLLNINRPKGKQPVKPAALNPYRSAGKNVETITKKDALVLFKGLVNAMVK